MAPIYSGESTATSDAGNNLAAVLGARGTEECTRTAANVRHLPIAQIRLLGFVGRAFTLDTDGIERARRPIARFNDLTNEDLAVDSCLGDFPANSRKLVSESDVSRT